MRAILPGPSTQPVRGGREGGWRACGELGGVAQQRAVLLPQQQQLAAVGARVGAADLVHVGVHDHDLAVHRHCTAPGRRRCMKPP